MNRKLSDTAEQILAAATAVVMLAAIYMVFVYVPNDKAQGPIQRIFYFHVSLAMHTYIAFAAVALFSALFLWKGTRTWDRLAHASAEAGMLLCSLVLITGPIWAKPVWGTYWTWDARLTTTLILWLIYGGYLMLRSATGPTGQGARYAAVLGIVGTLDIPIIHQSVYWWRTIHPAVIKTREGGSGLGDPRMQTAFMVCMLAFTLLTALLIVVRNRQARIADSVDELHALLAPAD